MKKSFLLIGLFILFSMPACKKFHAVPDDCMGYDYMDCNTWEPIYAEFRLKFTINHFIKNVPFEIYEGDVNSGQLVLKDTAYLEELIYYLDFSRYSVKATYELPDKKLIVIDGGEAEKWSNDVCDSVCWSEDSLQLDLQIYP